MHRVLQNLKRNRPEMSPHLISSPTLATLRSSFPKSTQTHFHPPTFFRGFFSAFHLVTAVLPEKAVAQVMHLNTQSQARSDTALHRFTCVRVRLW